MYINLETLEYPVSAQQIQSAHPHVSFPIPFEPCDGFAPVEPSSPPDHDADTHRAEEMEPAEQDGQWVQRWRVVPLTPAEIAARLAGDKARLLAAATARRWEVETGGIRLPGGLRIDTERVDQDSITRVLVNAQAAGITEVRFKAASGWAVLSLDQLRQIANAVALHVQACYDAEHAHHEAIELLTLLADARSYDIGQGWPSTGA